MKLEVGMYARTDNGIGKYIGYNEIEFWDGKGKANYREFLKEPSYNIIDLIEVGDYVNGMKVVAIDSDRRLYVPVDLGQPYDREFSDGCFYHTLLDMDTLKIKSIVTKEMFESISYEVGD